MALLWSARIEFRLSIDIPLRWSGESRPGDRSYRHVGNRDLEKISIAVIVHSLDRSLFTHLLDLYRTKISIALVIHSLDLSTRLITLQMYFLNALISVNNGCAIRPHEEFNF